MNPRPRTGHMDSQRSLMWERWKQGWTLHQIAHLFNRSHASVRVRTARWASRTVRVPRRPPAFCHRDDVAHSVSAAAARTEPTWRWKSAARCAAVLAKLTLLEQCCTAVDAALGDSGDRACA
jgi:hypothetical protein